MRISLLLIIFSIGCGTNVPLTIDSVASRTFFNVELSLSFEKQMEYYLSNKALKIITQKEGFTLYPPLSALMDPSNEFFCVFTYDRHPNFSVLNNGQLRLKQRADNTIEHELFFIFKGLTNAKKFINNYKNKILNDLIKEQKFETDKNITWQYSGKTAESHVIVEICMTPVNIPGYEVVIKVRRK